MAPAETQKLSCREYEEQVRSIVAAQAGDSAAADLSGFVISLGWSCGLRPATVANGFLVKLATERSRA